MDKQTFRQLDRLNMTLGLALHEVRFAISLVEVETPQTLEIDNQDFAAIMRQFARQLEAAKVIARQLFKTMDEQDVATSEPSHVG